MNLLTEEEVQRRGWTQPKIPDETEHNERDFYRSDVYLSWYNEMDRRAQRLHGPAAVEKRAAALKAKNHNPDQFGLLTDSGTHLMNSTQLSLRSTQGLTPTQRRIIGKQLDTQEAVLRHMRSLVGSADVERMYDTLTEAAIASADPKLIETWMKFIVGMPAQQLTVTRVDVGEMLRNMADAYENATEAEYKVVDDDDRPAE